ncbi:hypothetical protein GGF37_004105 [Kickxella alabastrina]|nr:hypothetical protein GGF37_004105 [Kickxella alabastrina]
MFVTPVTCRNSSTNSSSSSADTPLFLLACSTLVTEPPCRRRHSSNILNTRNSILSTRNSILSTRTTNRSNSLRISQRRLSTITKAQPLLGALSTQRTLGMDATSLCRVPSIPRALTRQLRPRSLTTLTKPHLAAEARIPGLLRTLELPIRRHQWPNRHRRLRVHTLHLAILSHPRRTHSSRSKSHHRLGLTETRMSTWPRAISRQCSPRNNLSSPLTGISSSSPHRLWIRRQPLSPVAHFNRVRHL